MGSLWAHAWETSAAQGGALEAGNRKPRCPLAAALRGVAALLTRRKVLRLHFLLARTRRQVA